MSSRHELGNINAIRGEVEALRELLLWTIQALEKQDVNIINSLAIHFPVAPDAPFKPQTNDSQIEEAKQQALKAFLEELGLRTVG